MKNRTGQLIIFTVFSTAVLAAGTKPLSREILLHLPGVVHSVHPVHFDNDGTQDLLICHSSNQTPPVRQMTLFLGRKNTSPDTTGLPIQISQDDIVFDYADLDDNDIMEILTLRRDGIYQITLTDSAQKTSCLIQTSSAFSAPDPTRIRHFPLALDLDEDEQTEICVPQSDRLEVYRLKDGSFVPVASFWIHPDHRVSDADPVQMTLCFPEYQLADFNGDGKKDLLAIQENRVDVFLMHGLPDAPASSLMPPDWTYDLGARRMVLSEIETLAPVSTRVEVMDLNNDGNADFIVTLAARSGFASSLSQIHIHLNRYGRIRPLPDQILTADNFLGEHLIRDFNRDGLLDLALFDFRLSYGMAARLILTRKVSHRYDFYLMQKDGSYPQKPDFQCSVSKKPRVSDPQSALFGACYAADFNRDGLTDLITPVDATHWQIAPGDSAAIFNKKARFTLDAPLTHSLEIADINGDGADDCIFFYPDDADRNKEVRIVLSTASKKMEGR